MRKGYSLTVFAILLVALLLLPGAFAADDVEINLSNLYIKNPKIIVEFNSPVRLQVYSIMASDGSKIFPICAKPQISQTAFHNVYELYTTTARDPDCIEGTPEYLNAGDYLITLQGIDAAGKYTKLYRYAFHASGLEITPVSPLSNVSASLPAVFIFNTTRVEPAGINEEGERLPVPALCRYDVAVADWRTARFNTLRVPVETTAQTTHTITFPQQTELYVICKESEGAGQEARYRMTLKHDTTPPRITSIVRTPDKVMTLTGAFGIMDVKLTTDDLSACNLTGEEGTVPFFEERVGDFSTYTTSHDIQLSFDPLIIGPTEQNFTYIATCRNLAGHQNSTVMNATVNFERALSISVLAPESIVNKSTFDLVVRAVRISDPSVAADSCYVNDNGNKLAANKMDAKTVDDGLGNALPVFSKTMVYGNDGKDDGNKSYAVSCYADEVMRYTYNITLDTVPPLTPTINASSFLCDNIASAKFNSSDAGTGLVMYAYTLSDDLGVIESNTTSRSTVNVTLRRAVRGSLVWTVAAVDGARHTSPANTTAIATTEGMDEDCGLPPFITLKSPNMGYAEEVPYDFIIATTRPAVCRYSLTTDGAWEDLGGRFTASRTGLVHTDSDVTQQSPRVAYIACNESGRIHRKQFRIGIDPTAPVISVTAEPNIVVDRTRRVVTLKVKTDDLTYCVVEGTPQCVGNPDEPNSPHDQAAYVRERTLTCDFRNIEDEDLQEFPYDITCQNLALLESSKEKILYVHLGADFTIDVLSPPEFTSESDITMIIRPSREAICVWDNNGTETQFTVVNGTHISRIGQLAEDTYSIPVICTSSDKEATAIVEFTIDKSVPVIDKLQGPAAVCPGIPAEFTYEVTTLDDEPLIIYAITATNVSLNGNTTDDLLSFDTEEFIPGNYTLTAKARNRANSTSTPVSAKFDVYSITSEVCTLPQDHCMNGELDPTENGVDCGGSCDACIACEIDDECKDGEICTDGYCKPNVPPASCINGVKDVGEEAVDCGGSCDTCAACDLDTDCDLGMLCNNHYCEPNLFTCTNDAACGTGKVCESGVCVVLPPEGCTSSNACADDEVCTAGVCTPISQPSGCVSDSECSGTQVCSAGRCITPSSMGCTMDSECSPDVCVEGMCVPLEEKSHLLSILLIVIGFAIMGGAGYFLYQQYEEKQAAAQRAAQSVPRQAPRATQLSPQMAARYNENPAARQAALEQEYAKRQAEREKRINAFQSFGSASAPTASATASAPSAAASAASTPAAPSSKPPPLSSAQKNDEEYIDLGAVKKKTQKAGKTKDATEDDDAFKELEKL